MRGMLCNFKLHSSDFSMVAATENEPAGIAREQCYTNCNSMCSLDWEIGKYGNDFSICAHVDVGSKVFLVDSPIHEHFPKVIHDFLLWSEEGQINEPSGSLMTIMSKSSQSPYQ